MLLAGLHGPTACRARALVGVVVLYVQCCPVRTVYRHPVEKGCRCHLQLHHHVLPVAGLHRPRQRALPGQRQHARVPSPARVVGWQHQQPERHAGPDHSLLRRGTLPGGADEELRAQQAMARHAHPAALVGTAQMARGFCGPHPVRTCMGAARRATHPLVHWRIGASELGQADNTCLPSWSGSVARGGAEGGRRARLAPCAGRAPTLSCTRKAATSRAWCLLPGSTTRPAASTCRACRSLTLLLHWKVRPSLSTSREEMM